MTTFQDLGLKKEILTAVTELGYEMPMPIQEQVIPFILNESVDLVALAQTGTGKTAAFGLPILHSIPINERGTQALILAPTRELCIQIAKDIESYGQHLSSMKIVPVYGGESIVNQFRRLDTPPQILVATPGRLIDLINRGKVNLESVKYLVLDEADEMLNMGFLEDLETILKSVPKTRRTMLFSATMPLAIAAIAKNYMRDFKEIAVGTRNSGAANVEHIYYMVQASSRYLALKRIVDINPDIYGIVFCRTRQETKEVAEKLMHDGYNADALHGDLSQAQRDMVMSKFRIRNLQILVATDVAARGLDVSDLTHVINYNMPTDIEIYTHRSGRTGRANKTGVSISIITQKERPRIKEIERNIKKTFTQQDIPNGMDVCLQQLYSLIDKMEHVQLNNEQIDNFMPHVMQKLEYMDKEEVIRRFVSLEFNRFLEYYKNAQDLNVKVQEGKSQRHEKSRRGDQIRLKLNTGNKFNATPRSILNLINEVTNDSSVHIGDIEITNKFTFFDVFEDQAQQILASFKKNAQPGIELSIAKGEKRQSTKNENYREKGRSFRGNRSSTEKREFKGKSRSGSDRNKKRY